MNTDIIREAAEDIERIGKEIFLKNPFTNDAEISEREYNTLSEANKEGYMYTVSAAYSAGAARERERMMAELEAKEKELQELREKLTLQKDDEADAFFDDAMKKFNA